MNRQKLVALSAALLCTSIIAACGGGGGQPQSGFKTMGRRWVQALSGGVRYVSPTSIQSQWIHDNGSAVGNVYSFVYGRSREFAARPEFFSRDGIHPSDAGYEFWARLVWPDVEKVINARRRGVRPKRIKRA